MKRKGGLKGSLNNLLASQAKKAKTGHDKGKEPAEAKAKAPKPDPVPALAYRASESVLLIGEGNFSFGHALCQLFPGSDITATAFDTKEVAMTKYPDLESHLAGIAEHNSRAGIEFSIDATKLDRLKQFKKKKFSRIVFNFPHAGTGDKDEARNVRSNQNLLLSFFRAAVNLLESPAELRARHARDNSEANDLLDATKVAYRKMAAKVATIDVTIKDCKPYSLWDIKAMAKVAGLGTVQSFQFPLQIYGPLGYRHRRTLGFEEGITGKDNEEITKHGGSRTYCFARLSDLKDNASGSLAGPGTVVGKRKRDDSDGDESD